MYFRIASTSETNDELYPLWWSNETGWVEFEDADVFTEAEQETVNLPITGVWVNETDYAYFASPKGYT